MAADVSRRRGFEAIDIGPCHVQAAKDRFGIDQESFEPDGDWEDEIWEDGDEDGALVDLSVIQPSPPSSPPPLTQSNTSPNHNPAVDPHFQPSLPTNIDGNIIPPPMARFRMNLTGLSQIHNLYFVAYEEDVYVYRPREAVRNILPTRPDYVLQSRARGPNYTGHIVPTHGHQVNNLVIGELGDDEVLALAFDDGDIIAYNIKTISNHIAALEKNPKSWDGFTPRPFFHQSVGITAWGLALHKKSRLIAVSCNFHTITIFFPALTANPTYAATGEGPSPPKYPAISIPEFTSPDIGFGNCTLKDLQDNSRRTFNYRTILHPGQEANNIPCISFSSNPDGVADKIAGIDISGNVWIFSVWDSNEAVKVVPYNVAGEIEPDGARGWGVLLVPPSSFQPVSTIQQAFGVYKESDIAQSQTPPITLDITSTCRFIPDAAVMNLRPALTTAQVEDDEGEDQDESVDADDNNMPMMTVTYPRATTRLPPTANKAPPVPPRKPTREWSIFRVSRRKMELTAFPSLGSASPSTLAVGVLSPPTWAQVGIDRMMSLAHIPELSLVIVGTMTGRVGLLTLTNPSSSSPLRTPRGFRVEWALPRLSDMAGALLHIGNFASSSDQWFLHGLAVSPVPQARRRPGLPHRPRFRLMLHYRNHAILSYELSRESGTDNLIVL